MDFLGSTENGYTVTDEVNKATSEVKDFVKQIHITPRLNIAEKDKSVTVPFLRILKIPAEESSHMNNMN